MAENPALEWNARGRQRPPPVQLTTILSRCSIRAVYAPPIVSLLDQQQNGGPPVTVAGQALEINASGDIRLMLDARQVDTYRTWIDIFLRMSPATAGHARPPCPAHSFLTCSRIDVVFYSSEAECGSFVPYGHLSLLEPHLVQQGDGQLDVSVYDLRLQLPDWSSSDGQPVRRSALPDPSAFPLALLDTKTGRPSPVSGVPPPFFHFHSTGDWMTGRLELGRPFKLNFQTVETLPDRVRYLTDRLDQLRRPDGQQEEPSGPDTSSSRNFHFKTDQMVLDVHLPGGVVVTAGLEQMAVNLAGQLDGQPGSKCRADWNVSGLSVRARQTGKEEDRFIPLLDPLQLDGHVQLVRPHWLDSPAGPGRLLHALCRADHLRLHAGPLQFSVVRSLLDLVQPEGAGPAAARPVEDQAVCPAPDEQHYQDDLRTGAFDFQIRDSTVNTLPGMPGSEDGQCPPCPRPYQVVFNVRPASMCWAYPQPRALTKVDVHPIPFIQAGQDSFSPAAGQPQPDSKIDCTLEYWDEPAEEFRPFRHFSLSESRVTRVQLARPAAGHARQDENGKRKAPDEELLEGELIFSDRWRIVMHLMDGQENSGRQPGRIIAAPPSLVACTRIDSYFNAAMIPSVQLALALNYGSLAVHHQTLPAGNVCPSADGQDFEMDGQVPRDFPVAHLQLDQLTARVRLTDGPDCRAVLHLAGQQVQANVINFQSLLDESVLEPTAIDVKMAATGRNLSGVTALVSSHRPLEFNWNQSVHHTLAAFVNACRPCPASYAHYLIRNDTQEPLRIGQSGTGESILLGKRRVHQYGWKMPAPEDGHGRLLHACTQTGRWRWCRPCDIDRPGTSVRLSGPSLPLIWSVRPVPGNGVQKEVTLRGQLQVANLLDRPLDVKLIPVDSAGSDPSVVTEAKGSVGANQLAASFVFPLDQLHSVRIRLPANSWSGPIPLDSKSNKNVRLVRGNSVLINFLKINWNE